MADGREPRLFSTRSLYQLCVSAVVDRFRIYKPYLVDLPKSVRFDLYYQVKRRQAAPPSSSSPAAAATAAARARGQRGTIESIARAMTVTLLRFVSLSPWRSEMGIVPLGRAADGLTVRGASEPDARNFAVSRKIPPARRPSIDSNSYHALDANVWRSVGLYESAFFSVVQREETMYIGGGIKRSGDFLQDAQGHQSSITPLENIPGERVT